MKAFIVNSKDLFDKKKNPHLKLSIKSVLKNKKIKKIFLALERENTNKPKK